MIIFSENGHLTDEQIDAWSQAAEEAYRKAAGKRAEPGETVRLGIEEILLLFRDNYGTKERCEIRGFKDLNGIRFIVKQRGKHKNPLEKQELDLSYDLLEHLGLRPAYIWREKREINAVSIPFPIKQRKNKMLIQILISLVLSVLTGFLINAMGWQSVEPVISELFSKMSYLFSALATPLVFFAVILGISGMGDAASFGRVGLKLLGRMMITYGLAMAALVITGLFMGLGTTSAASGDGSFGMQLLDLVLDIIPNNLMEPFRIDNDLQVIVLAIFIGVVMLSLGDRVARIKTAIDEVSRIVYRMMFYLCKLLPIFVYLGVTHIIITSRLEQVKSVSKILLLCLIGSMIVILITMLRTKIVTKLSFREILSPQLPSLMINLTTSSQISALPESMRCLKEKFGVDEKLVDFGLPLGIVVFMPNGAIMLGAITWVLATMGSGALPAMMIIRIAFVAVIVAIAAPPIPGSAFAVMPILFSACGTDMALMPLAVIVGSTFGYVLPAMNGFCLQEEILMSAWKDGLVQHCPRSEASGEDLT